MKILCIIVLLYMPLVSISQGVKSRVSALEEKSALLELVYPDLKKESLVLRKRNKVLSDSVAYLTQKTGDLQAKIAILQDQVSKLMVADMYRRDTIRVLLKPVANPTAVGVEEKGSLLISTGHNHLNSVAPTPEPKRSSNTTYRTYYTGPRGGCYYIGGTGKRVYVDRSLCR